VLEFSAQATKQTKAMIRLTRWIVALTLMMLIGLAVQIVLAL